MQNLSPKFPKGSVSCCSFHDISHLIFFFSPEELISSFISFLIVNCTMVRWIEKKFKNQHHCVSLFLSFFITYYPDKLFQRYISILLSFMCHHARKLTVENLRNTTHFVSNSLKRFMFSIPFLLEDLKQPNILSYCKPNFFLVFCIITVISVIIAHSTRLSTDLSFLTESEIETITEDVTVKRIEVGFIIERIGGIGEPTNNEGEQTMDCICMGFEEMSSLFWDVEPSLDEVNEAFSVFDQNRDGLFDASDLQRVLITLGIKQGVELGTCAHMIG